MRRTARLVRSTSVPIAERLCFPTIRSPSAIADAGAHLDDRRPAMDQHRRSDEARGSFGGLAAPLASRPSRAQLGCQHSAQPTLAAQIQCLIDRFVADVPLRTVRIFCAQPRTDLLRT